MAKALFEFGPFQLDPAGRRLMRAGELVAVTPKALDTLIVLVENRGRELSRAELIARIWPDTSVGEHNLNQCIAVLRKTLGDEPRQPDYIATLPGRGYTFVAEVHIVTNGATSPDPTTNPTQGNSDPFAVVPERPAPVAPPSIRTHKMRAAALLAILMLTLLLGFPVRSWLQARANSRSTTSRSISVLPFEDLDPQQSQPENEYVARGLTQELSAELARLPGLKVIVGRVPSQPGSGSAALDPKMAGRTLHVQCLLLGTVRRTAEQYRLAVQLVSSEDGRELWSGVYTFKTAEMSDIEEQILQHTADTLVVPWSANRDQQWARRRVENPEAHDLYLQARYLWSKRDSTSMRRSAALLQQAIAKDPTYARAYSGLADTYAVMAVNGQMALSESVPLARAAAAKALQIDPTMAEPHAALGLLLFEIDWDFAAAQEGFRRCLALNPGYATGHHWAGINLTAMGQFEEADAELRKAQELDPLSPMISEGLFENYFAWHRFDDAMQTIRALQARNPVEYAPFSFAIGESYEGKGMYREAEDVYRQAYDGHDDVAALRLAHAQAMNGKRKEARTLLEQVEHHPGTNACPAMCAKVHLALGEPEIALAYLKQEVDEHDATATNLRDDPDFAALHADPRYQQLLERILNKSGAVEAKR